jgi:TonB family protein
MNARFPTTILCSTRMCLLVACGIAAMGFQSAPDGAKPDSPPPGTSEQTAAQAQGGTYRVGGGVSPPSVTYKKDPGYSEEARKAHLWGTVVLQIIVGSDGMPHNIKVIRPLGMGLDEIAVETVSEWRFRPGVKDGKSVNVLATIEVNFRLLDTRDVWRIGRLVFEGDASSRPVLAKWRLPEGPVPDHDLRLTLKINVDNSGNVAGAALDGPFDPTLAAVFQEAVLKWKFHVPDRSKGTTYSATLDLTHGNPPPARMPSRDGEIQGEPKNAEEAYREGVRLTRAHSPEQAIALLTKAILEKPEWEAAYSARAQAYYNMHRYHEAVDDLTVAIRLNPNQASLYDRRGLSYSYAGRHDIAIDDYNRAIELSATPSSQYYNNRGWAYTELGQLDKALTDLNQALEITPDYARAFGNRGVAYMKLKDYSHAIADFTAALQLTATRSLYEQRAEAKRLSGDEPGAAEDMKQANEFVSTPAR